MISKTHFPTYFLDDSTSTQAGQYYYSNAHGTIFVCNGTLWEASVAGDFNDSVLLTRTIAKQLVQYTGSRWRLCFRASKYSFYNYAWHAQCDNKGPLVAIYKANGRIFGGYSDIAWNKRGYYVNSWRSFVWR